MTWTPEQWILVITAVIGSLTGAIISILNAFSHSVAKGLLVQAKRRLEDNTATTEQTMIQLQNNNRAVAKAEEKIENHTAELQSLVNYLREQNEELATRVTQANSLIQDLRQMNVVLKTAERQQQFDRDIAELQALVVEVTTKKPEGSS